MNVLLTGKNGFIGSFFYKNYADKYNIKTFSFQYDNFEKLDLSNIDVIVHLSALVHQMGGASKEAYNKINVDNSFNLAKKAKKSGVKHFIFMSTIKVYGEESITAYTEDTICTPQDDYGRSKLKAEEALATLENNSFTLSIIRTPIVYGSGVKANILNLTKLVKISPLLPFAKIENKRSMVYIENLLALIDTLIEQKKSGIYLASDNSYFSTTEFINYIALGLEKKVYLVKIPFFEVLLKNLRPQLYQRLYQDLYLDNSQTKRNLNFENPFTSEVGVVKMLKGFK